jgi:uncharacterized membrane protein YhaH (DUF805 family)
LVATLLLVSGHNAPAEIPVRGRLQVGRSRENQIVLHHDTVSGTHAEIRVEAGCPIVVDANSTNGTYINGERVQRQLLRDGDRVRFDEVEYRVVWPRAAAATRVNPAAGNGAAKTVVNPAVAAKPSSASSAGVDPVPPAAPASPAVQQSTATAAGPERPAAKSTTSPETTASASADGDCGTVDGSSASGIHDPSPLGADPENGTVIGPHVRPSSQREGLVWMLFSVEGRIGRLHFFLAAMAMTALLLGLNALVQNILFGSVTFDSRAQQYWLAAFIGWIIALWPMVALGTKRFHDQDRSGHWCWLLLVPVISIIPSLMLLFLPGTKGPNRFGVAPT